MKKNIIIAAISVASIILLAASCQKQEEPEIKNESKTFTAVIDQELTKTTITSEYKVNWDEGDQIDINAGTTYSATPNTSDATKATFTKVSGSDPDGEYGYTAVYPASLFKNSGYELPTTQTYATGKFNAPMCAMSDTESLEFKNFCGVLCFALKGTDKVRSIAVTANEQLCGSFEFMDATAICFTGENEGYTVTLDCGTEGIQLNETTATNFYIYLPPCTYTAGMKMTVTDTDGVKFEKTTTKTVTIERSNIYTFNWTPSFGPVLPEGALPGKFSVSADKQVYFSKGNLYYDESQYLDESEQRIVTVGFCFETNQYDYQVTRTPKHVSYFYWSTNPEHAAKGYDTTGSTSSGDVIFSNDTESMPKRNFTVNGVTGQFRTLSKDEWSYLFNHHSYKWVTVNGVKGYAIAPDGFDGTIADTYADNAALATDNLLFLPAAGGEIEGLDDRYIEENGFYWSSSSKSEKEAYGVWFHSSGVTTNYPEKRSSGYCVRLVKDC